MKTALLVDDARCVREVMGILVGSFDFEIVGEADDGMEGVEKYKELKPDIVFMDVMMKEMGGLEALKKIIEFDPGANVIITSSRVSESNIAQEAIALGAKALLPKPLDVDDVKEVIEKINSEKV